MYSLLRVSLYKFDKVVNQFLEIGTSDITFMGRDRERELKWLAFSLYPLSFFLYSPFNLEIKKKSGSSINPDIHHSKVPSSDTTNSSLIRPPCQKTKTVNRLYTIKINKITEGFIYLLENKCGMIKTWYLSLQKRNFQD